MKRILHVLTFIAGAMAAVGVFAKESRLPVGSWQSPAWKTYTNRFQVGSDIYLNIEVAKDGSFRGVYGIYLCSGPGLSGPTAGTMINSCSRSGSYPVSGKFSSDRQGVIDLEQLGNTTFTWSAPNADELAIDLPKDWQGDPPVLYQSRLTRDGKGKPAAESKSSAPARDEGPLLSAVALYREFVKDSNAALARYQGKTLVLEGRRGNLIQLSDGRAAVHIPDGYQSRALVLEFPDSGPVSAIIEGARFRFQCTMTGFDYQYVQANDCSVVP